MRILIVAMKSIHTVRWVSQLKDSGHEVHWFDILNGGYIKEWNWVVQHTNWRYKFGDFRGRFFIKKYIPKLHKLFENNVEKEFESLIEKIKPNIVHSFVMFNSVVPILSVMKKHKSIKWIYSSWGTDLFYHQSQEEYRKGINMALPNVDYLFTDCKRDAEIAKALGFIGRHLGVFPGGGGYDIKKYEPFIKPLNKKDIILIKGYEGEFGRAINVVKALISIKNELENFRIVIFGADKDFVEKYKLIADTNFIDVRGKLKHNEVIELMGESLIYIGNSVSDGIPNTLLEAVIMEVFPIQSNPGGASEEIIKDGINGFLINDCEIIDDITQKIKLALFNYDLLEKAASYNRDLRSELRYKKIKKEVLKKYDLVFRGLEIEN